jgi:hypothetical protein
MSNHTAHKIQKVADQILIKADKSTCTMLERFRGDLFSPELA